MKKIGIFAILMLALPGVISAARLQYSLPPGLPGAQLLSAGTQAMLDHINGQANTRLKSLKAEYKIEDVAGKSTQVIDGVAKAKKAYEDKITSIRKHYTSLLSIELSDVRSSINPSTSALGDVMYTYTVRNNTDMLITDIVYKPMINGKNLPTSSSIFLEFIDPETLKSGLGPQETMTNKGHDPEKFSFFISEISQAELKNIEKNFSKGFSINIIDMHFADQKGYKGQFKPRTFEEAFAWQLRPLQDAVRQAEASAAGTKEVGSKINREYAVKKDAVTNQQKKALLDLKKSSIRYTARQDRKGRSVFDDIPEGTYFLYAPDSGGRAVFEKVTVGKKKVKAAITQLKKDPFVP